MFFSTHPIFCLPDSASETSRISDIAITIPFQAFARACFERAFKHSRGLILSALSSLCASYSCPVYVPFIPQLNYSTHSPRQQAANSHGAADQFAQFAQFAAHSQLGSRQFAHANSPTPIRPLIRLDSLFDCDPRFVRWEINFPPQNRRPWPL
jgi:hypothetical protein